MCCQLLLVGIHCQDESAVLPWELYVQMTQCVPRMCISKGSAECSEEALYKQAPVGCGISEVLTLRILVL